MAEFIGWHFLPADRKLTHGDGRLVVLGEPILAARAEVGKCGLHASTDILGALDYAPGPILCRVRLAGEMRFRGTLAAATERTVLAWADATTILHEFACRCAEDVIHLCDKPEVAVAAIDMKRRWLKGEATDEELAAAGAAAGAAARAAAWAAAGDAAGAAAGAAAGDAAGAAAGDAAGAAARDTAGAAAWDAARDAAGAAAGAAARAAAWAAARDAQRKRFEEMAAELLGLTT